MQSPPSFVYLYFLPLEFLTVQTGDRFIGFLGPGHIDDGELCGILSRTGLIKALAALGAKALVSEVMLRDFPTVESTAPLEGAMAKLNEADDQILPVMHRGKLVGLLTGENVGEFVLIRTAEHEADWQRRFHEQHEQQLGLLRGATAAARSRHRCGWSRRARVR